MTQYELLIHRGLVRGTRTESAGGYSESCPVFRCRQTGWELWSLAWSMLCARLSWAIGAHKLHKLLERVLVVMVAYGGVGEIRAGLLDDRRGGEMQS